MFHTALTVMGFRLLTKTQWTDWLALDISADMVYSRELNEMRESE